ncbi:DUF1778 domain-containing protein [Nonomuraea sp. B5E05]|uniref:type II toxin-antitoxin system TacA family antitoxin n=1 Tax=Nonomuraea sp. B5E05 TaxID=3153569 RepID=UPI00326168C8
MTRTDLSRTSPPTTPPHAKTKIRINHKTPKTRLEVRISAEDKELIESAADAARETTTSFVLNALREAAQEVLRREQVTSVPPDFFEAVIASLEEPPQRNEALTAAARRRSDTVKR